MNIGSPPETSRFYVDHFSRWARWPPIDVKPAVRAYLDFTRSTELLSEINGEPTDRAERLLLGARKRKFLDTRTKAGELLDPIIGAGLAGRVGTCLLPPALLPTAFRWEGMSADEAQTAYAEMSAELEDRIGDWLAWKLLEWCVVSLVGVIAGPIRVCPCTAVFRPRRSDAKNCDLCRHKPAAPIFGLAPLKPGEKMKVRVPAVSGEMITSWRVGTIGTSTETGDTFATSRTNIKGSPRDRKRRGRRA